MTHFIMRTHAHTVSSRCGLDCCLISISGTGLVFYCIMWHTQDKGGYKYQMCTTSVLPPLRLELLPPRPPEVVNLGETLHDALVFMRQEICDPAPLCRVVWGTGSEWKCRKGLRFKGIVLTKAVGHSSCDAKTGSVLYYSFSGSLKYFINPSKTRTIMAAIDGNRTAMCSCGWSSSAHVDGLW